MQRRYRDVQGRVNRLFSPQQGGRVGYVLDWLIMLLIVANVSAVVMSTVDPIYRSYEGLFRVFEVFSVAVFTVEYVARVWSAVAGEGDAGPVTGRLRFASRPLVVIDLLAIAPFYLAVTGIGVDLRFLRALRLIRLFRLLKLARYSAAMRTFVRVLEERKERLVIAIFANGLLLVVASSVMYFLERSAQPDAFSSIPATMWWGVAALTTVGYGDMYPITAPGQVAGAVTAVLGIGMFALPASILAAGFMDATEERVSEPKRCPHCGDRVEPGEFDDIE